MNINQKEIEALCSGSAYHRYEYFIKKVVDWGEAWGLYDEGWALAGDDDEAQVFPIWPAREYANLCAKNMWESFTPRKITLDDFLKELIPTIENDGISLGIFPTPNKMAVITDFDRLKKDIALELSKY